MAAKVVLDTNVLVAAIRSQRGASRVLLEKALASEYLLLISVPLVLEYEAVLTRDEHRRAAGLSREDIEAIVDAIVRIALPVNLAYLWRPILTDPADDMVLETAANGGADMLVTLNERHFLRASKAFRLDVMTPGLAPTALREQR